MAISSTQVAALGRQVVTFVMGVITALAATHIISATDAQSATDSVNAISTSLASIITGVTTLVALASAVWATVSASLKSQIASVQASPTAQVVTSDPAIVKAVKGVKLVPQTEIVNVKP